MKNSQTQKSKDVYIQWLKQSLEINLKKENYEICSDLRDKIKSLGGDF